jgi:DNA primase
VSGRIPQSFIDDLLGRVDIVDLVHGRVPLKKSGREFSACCPFHNEKTPSFTVSPTKQFYHCFGCGAHGNAIGFLMEYDHLEFVEAIEELARGVGVEIPREAAPSRPRADPDLYQILDRADQFFRLQLRSHPDRARVVEYLEGRGLIGDAVADAGIGFAPPGWDNLCTKLRQEGVREQQMLEAGLVIERDGGGVYDRFRSRVMFPIRDRRGRVMAFGGRVLGDDSPKYLNSPETPTFQKGRELYGFFEARSRERSLERLVVVEGYMDVVALRQFGIGYAVATLGTATTREHLEILFRTVPTVLFCFDGDRAGRDAAWRALENALPLMRDGREARFLFLPEGEDPDSLVRREGRAGFEARLDQADPLSDVMLQTLGDNIEIATPDGRARLLERARPLLNRIPGGAFWELMVERLAALTHMSADRVRRLLTERGAESGPRGSENRPQGANVHRTPVRHAIALLLYKPDLAAGLSELDLLQQVPERGIPLLLELLEMARANPQIHTGAILERYRDTPQEQALVKLAEWSPEIPDQHLEAELRDTLARLTARHTDRRVLLDKLAKGEPLSPQERETLKQTARRREESGETGD